MENAPFYCNDVHPSCSPENDASNGNIFVGQQCLGTDPSAAKTLRDRTGAATTIAIRRGRQLAGKNDNMPQKDVPYGAVPYGPCWVGMASAWVCGSKGITRYGNNRGQRLPSRPFCFGRELPRSLPFAYGVASVVPVRRPEFLQSLKSLLDGYFSAKNDAISETFRDGKKKTRKKKGGESVQVRKGPLPRQSRK